MCVLWEKLQLYSNASKGFKQGLVSLETRLFLIVVHIFLMRSVAPESLDSKGHLENQNMGGVLKNILVV